MSEFEPTVDINNDSTPSGDDIGTNFTAANTALESNINHENLNRDASVFMLDLAAGGIARAAANQNFFYWKSSLNGFILSLFCIPIAVTNATVSLYIDDVLRFSQACSNASGIQVDFIGYRFKVGQVIRLSTNGNLDDFNFCLSAICENKI